MPGFELFGNAERKEVNDVLQSGVLMRYGFDGMRQGHWKAKELEQAICQALDVQYAQLTSSGTTALNTALAILGIGVGDEVILPSFTFVASFEAIIQVGAKPVFVDIDDTLGLDAIAVKAAITPKTKAIMVVHMCGAMVDLDPLIAISKEKNIYLIEDTCQAWGASYKGKKLGTIGDVGVFSFDFVKTITCGEGGAVVSNNKMLYEKADQFTDHGHDHVGNDRGAENHPFVGTNFRISELHAAVGLAQIRRTDEFLTIQRHNKKVIKEALSQISEISFRRIPDEAGDNAGFLSFFLPDATLSSAVEKVFKEQGIDAYWNYYNNNWHYIRRWDHLKSVNTMSPICDKVKQYLLRLQDTHFSKSDYFISRNISCLIKLSWTEKQLNERAKKMVAAIKSVL